MISKETEKRIKQDASNAYIDVFDNSAEYLERGYIAGAEAEATRAEGLVSALEKLSQFGGYVATVATEALNNYNKPDK